MQVSFSDSCVMSSCVKPSIQSEESPVVLLHGFDRLLHNLGLFVVSVIIFSFSCSSHLIIQFMFRMEIRISVAGGSWFRNLGR